MRQPDSRRSGLRTPRYIAASKAYLSAPARTLIAAMRCFGTIRQHRWAWCPRMNSAMCPGADVQAADARLLILTPECGRLEAAGRAPCQPENLSASQ
jgi:hypothetical protein